MAEVHQHPDGLVYVRTDGGTYMDTAENFAVDFGQALPALPAGADDRIYVPGKRHAIMGDGNIIEGGPMPWDLGDQAIASVAALLAAQTARRAPPPATLDEAKAAKDAEVEREFRARHTAAINFTVGGQAYDWDADEGAINNIMGVVLMITAGVPVPDPRPWTPDGALTPVDITHAELIGLGASIAARKDALFVIKKTKQAAVAALSQVADVEAYDATSGW